MFVKRIEIGQKCKEKTQFAQYEIVVNFEDVKQHVILK